ncbi:P-loop containing nucleoside triphosphate hydrolase protein [Baffinella frigidus]|nr:P-loop containing nucleoside triphosphate hydrolase protein [Cryptophyta sp. CCMP2293]
MAGVEAKVVVLGDTGVGKTCLVQRFVEGKFVPHGASTIGASFMVKKMNIDGAKLTMQIWDTAGQERFRSMAPMYYRGAAAAILVLDVTSAGGYYRGAAAAILVLDVTSADSFDKVRSWVEELKSNAPGELVLALACNKAGPVDERRADLVDERRVPLQEAEAYRMADLVDERRVPLQEAEAYARSIGATVNPHPKV